MKRILFLLVVCLIALGLWAEETTDYIKITPAKVVTPGGDAIKLTVSLVGSDNYYTAYNMDIHLPEGMNVEYKNKKPRVAIIASSSKASSFYPSTEEEIEDDEEEEGYRIEYKYTHSLACSYGVVGDRVLRVACNSNSNEVFKAVSGDLFTIYVKASAYQKPGVAQITIDGVALKVAGGSQYEPASRIDENVTIGTNSSVTYEVSSDNKYGTLVLPFDLAIPSGMKAYTFSSYYSEGNTLSLSEASTFTAYTPYVIYAADGASGTLSGTVDASKYVEVAGTGMLKGAIVPQTKSEGYVLQNNSGGVQFYNMDSQEFTIPSGRCWLELDAGVKSVNVEFEDMPTGIANVDADVDADSDSYNTAGQKVTGTYKGVVIRNGKKYVNK